MPDTVEPEDATSQPAAAAAVEGGSTSRKQAAEESKEQVTFSEPATDTETEQPTDAEPNDAPPSSENARLSSDSATDAAATADTAADTASSPAAAPAESTAEGAVSVDDTKPDEPADAATATLSIRVGSATVAASTAVASGGKSVKGKKAAGKAAKSAATPQKTPTAAATKTTKTSRPTSSSSSATTTARKAASQPPLSVAVDSSTSQPATARIGSLSVPSPALRSSRSPRSSITSALPSPSKQRTIEETLAYWPLPTPREGGLPLSPLFGLVLDCRVEAVLAHIASIPIHERLEAVNCYDGSGNTPLMYALAEGKQAMLELLLDYGCDVNGVNERRNCPLHLAVHHGWKRALHTLIEYGANIKQENWEHQQPHQMHKSTDKQQQYLTLLNAAHEATQAKVAAKQLLVVEREVRGYYRAMFDLLDTEGLGGLSWYRVRAVMEVVLAEREKQRAADNPPAVVRLTAADREKLREKEKEAAGVAGEAGGTGAAVEVDWVGRWFSELDVDHNGVLSFNEFLSAVMSWRSEQEKEQKKGAGKGKSKKKK